MSLPLKRVFQITQRWPGYASRRPTQFLRDLRAMARALKKAAAETSNSALSRPRMSTLEIQPFEKIPERCSDRLISEEHRPSKFPIAGALRSGQEQ